MLKLQGDKVINEATAATAATTTAGPSGSA